MLTWTAFDRGGHFPAMEVPQLLVRDGQLYPFVSLFYLEVVCLMLLYVSKVEDIRAYVSKLVALEVPKISDREL